MDKSLFKEYTKWCEENGKNPLDEESVREFKLFKKEQEEKEEAEKAANSKKEHKEELVAKQQEIWDMFCKYCGVKAKYDEEYMFEVIDGYIRSFVMAATICTHAENASKTLEKLMK